MEASILSSRGGFRRRGWSRRTAGREAARPGPSLGRWRDCGRGGRRRCTVARRTRRRPGGSRRRRRGAAGGCRAGRTPAPADVAVAPDALSATCRCPRRRSPPPSTTWVVSPSSAGDALISSDVVAGCDVDVSISPLLGTSHAGGKRNASVWRPSVCLSHLFIHLYSP